MRRLLALLLSLPLVFGLFAATAMPAEAAAKRVPAANLLVKLKVDQERRVYSYDRDDFDHWVTKKGKCDTREMVLIAESKKKVKKNKSCTVKSGRWINEYNGRTVKSPRSLDIDHRVALAEAWRSGGYKWNANMRRGFANDLKYRHSLLAVGRSTNRAKSDRDPADWEPAKGKCQYAARWIAVKYRWNLTVDQVEKNALEHRLETCGKKRTMVEKPAKGKGEAKKKKKKKSGGGGGGGGAVPPVSGYDCPSSHPIKGNASSMIYHVPSGAYYSRTKPEECFASESAARSAGYRKSQR
ncbi:hypothetical protein H9L21_01045 [Aeromicrobium senzhongii]|uniref:GmrSD restriction endonucleases C-terminal domain-containing protein n=1 Tax=Aeromicrobium senzhongii TaxID=2663859 RepID=A0ABX6SWE3_9ACTN|nr:HNH endonuclease family protein [Aeromicrobium senzhongii]MTB88440.1 hypothetical protein [Aeromicrobium senzhongii]QNL94595.1 hypothetical protein H9L21_01045 [Aeromicrobium senzhongii]